MSEVVKHNYNVIDLFSGCGGLSLGLYMSGWNGLFAIEKSPFAFETLKYNLIDRKKHFEWPSWLEQTSHDINEVLSKHKEDLLALRGSVDLVAGGPPCQGFSMAGKRVEGDIRNQLVFSYIEFIKLVQPRMILFENVRGFTYAFNKKEGNESVPYSEIVIKELRSLKYNVKPHIIDFSKYGVPQRRKRFILVGIKDGDASAFEPLLESLKQNFLQSKSLSAVTTVGEAISDLLQSKGQAPTPDRKGFMSGQYGVIQGSYQKLMRGNEYKKGQLADSHSFAKHNDGTIQLFTNLLKNYPVKGKRIENKEREFWNIKKRGITILDDKSMAPTLTGHPDDYIHFSEPRILTAREYARIQSFPDWYEFKSKYTTGGLLRKIEVPRYTQIGNAIPPLFAELAGLAIKKMLDNGRSTI